MTRSTAPIAVLVATGLVSLGGTVLLPTSTVTTVAENTKIGQPQTQVTTVDNQYAAVAIALLVLAVAAFAGAAALAVLRARAKRHAQ
jgi:1,4-dihydroxy-2-naphthoyl-CoA synthase